MVTLSNRGPLPGRDLIWPACTWQSRRLPRLLYSPALAKSGTTWEDEHLDAWLADPQRLIPGSVMLHRQNDPAVRRSIIAPLKEQH